MNNQYLGPQDPSDHPVDNPFDRLRARFDAEPGPFEHRFSGAHGVEDIKTFGGGDKTAVSLSRDDFYREELNRITVFVHADTLGAKDTSFTLNRDGELTNLTVGRRQLIVAGQSTPMEFDAVEYDLPARDSDRSKELGEKLTAWVEGMLDEGKPYTPIVQIDVPSVERLDETQPEVDQLRASLEVMSQSELKKAKEVVVAGLHAAVKSSPSAREVDVPRQLRNYGFKDAWQIALPLEPGQSVTVRTVNDFSPHYARHSYRAAIYKEDVQVPIEGEAAIPKSIVPDQLINPTENLKTDFSLRDMQEYVGQILFARKLEKLLRSVEE